jgi:hypothetical protein
MSYLKKKGKKEATGFGFQGTALAGGGLGMTGSANIEGKGKQPMIEAEKSSLVVEGSVAGEQEKTLKKPGQSKKAKRK